MKTRDLVVGDSFACIGQRYALRLEEKHIVVNRDLCDGSADDEREEVKLRAEFPSVRQATAASLHEALETLESTLKADWLTHERIYLLSEFCGGFAVEAFGLEAVVAERAEVRKQLERMQR